MPGHRLHRLAAIGLVPFVAFASGMAAAQAGLDTLPRPVTDSDFAPVDRDEAALGWLLFYDPILSGNRNIACATCHHPRLATSDGLSLGLGEGGIGLGPERRPDPANMPEERIPRNSPALFNLGAYEFTVMFHDGRIEVDPTRPSGFRTPLEADMPTGFASLLSAQTMFPVLSPEEMAGQYNENEISRAVRQGRISGEGGAWDLISARVAAIPDYQARFETVYPHIGAGAPLDFTDISNAIAAFIELEWRADNSAFDRHLRGEAALPGAAAEGMALFYGPAGCAACHSGPFQTDHGFHAMGQPQIGPGKAMAYEGNFRDMGRYRVTGHEGDKFAFRTPSLRNVTLTGPWGHAGAFSDLGDFIRHHLDPVSGIDTYRDQTILPDFAGQRADWALWDDVDERAAIARAVMFRPVPLSDAEISALLAFLEALEDREAIAGVFGIPDAVPSGLPVDR